MNNSNKPKRKVGRPKLPGGANQKYQRIAIYPETYLVLKKKSILEKKTIADLIKEQFNKW
jgi:hypothetical protein